MPDRRQDLTQRGLRVSFISIAWTVAASGTEIVLGVTHHLLTLVAFGLSGVLDAAGSVTLVVHFRHALRHDELAEAHERRATLVVSIGLCALGLLTAVQSVRRFAAGTAGHETAAGTVIAAASVVVLAVLATEKRHVGRRVGSSALVADGVLSASGAVLGALAVVGSVLGSTDRWWWVDPAAATAIALAAGAYGTSTLWQEQRRHRAAAAAPN